MNYSDKHKTEGYIVSPSHKVSIAVVGAGGTGSEVVSALARMDIALKAMNHPGIFITVFDFDTVSPANIGRQLYCYDEINMNKAIALVTRINRFYGSSHHAVPLRFQYNTEAKYNIIISCVDTVQSRIDIKKIIDKLINNNHNYTEYRLYYWMDIGNGKNYGQTIIGTTQNKDLKQFFDVYTEPIEESINEPSCSLAEALYKQDLYINSTIAQLSVSLIWKLFKNELNCNGFYLNLQTMNLRPITINNEGK